MDNDFATGYALGQDANDAETMALVDSVMGFGPFLSLR